MAEPHSEWVTRRPASELAPFVDRYVGYRLSGVDPGVHRGLPSRHLTFIVSIGPEIDVVAQTDPAQSPDRYRCVLGGLQASPALIAYDDRLEGVTIELTPAGCRALLGLPARELWNTSLELGDVTGRVGNELWERLQHIAEWGERFRACDEVLGRLLREDSLEPALRRSWQLLVSSAGAMPVEELAADDRLDPAALRTPLRGRVRTVAEARGPSGSLRPGPAHAADTVPRRSRRSPPPAATSTRRT